MFDGGVDEKCPAPKERERNQSMQTQREPLLFLPIYIYDDPIRSNASVSILLSTPEKSKGKMM
jgi:hypothetical protein